jgi:hypothetical protein
MRRKSLVAVVLVIGCTGPGSPAPRASTPSTAPPNTYMWTMVSPPGSGAFPQDWKPGKWPMTIVPVRAFGGDLWMTTQAQAWSSADGLVWTHHDKADWGERISSATTFFRDKLWMFGGQEYTSTGPSTGKDAGAFLNDIWMSADGTTWEAAGQAAWPPRSSVAVVVFHDKLWLFGGATHVLPDGTADQFLNDIWTSDDGLQWTQVVQAAPWSPRDHPHVVVLRDALYLIGGHPQADVWRSADGTKWTLLTADAGWAGRLGYGTLVFDDQLWMYGGWLGPTTNAHNDIWSSSDGARWTRQAEHAPWTPRDGGHCIVFQDKLWIFSDKHTGSKDSWAGDIWTMSKAA